MSSEALNAPAQFIAATQCLDLRTRILRPGQPIESCLYEGDDWPSTFHLGVFINKKIVCNGTFMAIKNPLFSKAKLPYRLRGMATDTFFQGQNLGTQILIAAEKILLDRNCDLLWFNARVGALHFYEKNGFTAIEEVFDIPGAGPHKVMYKWLARR